MNPFGKHRNQIWNQHQHPYKHALSEFVYSNDALPGVTNLESTMNWLVAVLYPNNKTAVATPAALPLTGNTLNDYRVVQNDGDGKAASYRWEQREGEATPSWHKIYDMDFGTDSILAAFLNVTQDLYYYKYGKTDVDAAGVALTGINAGQHLWGGKLANQNLTLHANSGDGTGAQTGYIQTDDNIRPTTDATYSIGTTLNKFVNIWLSGLLKAGTLTAGSGSITDTSGAITFGSTNLTTTGDITGNAVTATTSEIGQLNLGTNVITSDTNIISLLAQTVQDLANLVTTQLTVKNGVNTLTLTVDGVKTLYNSSPGVHNFNAQAITGVSTLTATTANATNGTLANFTFSGDTITETTANPVTFNAASVGFSGDVSGVNLSFTSVTGTTQGRLGNYTFNATDAATNTANSDFNINPNGTGKIVIKKDLVADTDNTFNLGSALKRIKTLFLGTSVSDGTNAIPATTVTSFRNANTGALDGQALFWNAATSTWLPSYADSEVDHTTISNLLGGAAGDGGHSQFLKLTGRAGGQTSQGGIAASEDLVLESTAHATKGLVKSKDSLVPFTTSTPSLGSAALKWLDLYASGENKGLREENTATANNFNAASIGRKYFNTTVSQSYSDAGTVAKYPAYFQEYTENISGSNVTLPFSVESIANLTNAALVSISDITLNSGIKGNRFKVLVNKTGVTVTIKNSASLKTGTGGDITFDNEASVFLAHDGTGWNIIGKSGVFGTTPVVNSFTGDGTTTTFALTQDPGLIANTMVFNSGAYQEKSTYSLSSGSIVFGVAPASGNTIQVISGITYVVNTPAAASVTRTSLAASGHNISASSGAFSTLSNTYVDVTNLTGSVTTTGRPVEIKLIGDGTNFAVVEVTSNSAAVSTCHCYLQLFRGATSIAVYQLKSASVSSGIGFGIAVPSSSFSFIDTPAAGTYTYKWQIVVLANCYAAVSYTKQYLNEVA